MKLAPIEKPLEFDYGDGVVFLVKPHASAYDVFAMGMCGEVKDGILKMSLESHFEAVLRRFVIGWRGMEDENGKPLPYSFETLATRFPRDPKRDVFSELYLFIKEHTDLEIKPEAEAEKKD